MEDKHSYIPNPFVSLKVQIIEGIETSLVLDFPHPEIGRLAPVYNYTGGPFYLQIIHERNILNRLSGKLNWKGIVGVKLKNYLYYYLHKLGWPMHMPPMYFLTGSSRLTRENIQTVFHFQD